LIFLYNFTIQNKGIDFVLNEHIAEDMYEDLDKKLKPLVYKVALVLSNYMHLSVSPILMTGDILDTTEFEVMLSKGLGSYFNPVDKNILFSDAKAIANILIEVMDRRSDKSFSCNFWLYGVLTESR